MLDNFNFSPLEGAMSPSYTKKTYNQTSNVDSRQYSSIYSPSYQIQIESPQASLSKKDLATSQPAANFPAPVISDTSAPPRAPIVAGGGMDLTGIVVVGVIMAGAYFILRK